MSASYKEVVGEKEDGQSLGGEDVMKISLKTFKWEIIRAMGYYLIGALLRVAFSIIIFYLFKAV